MPPVTIIATIRTINGKPNDPGAPPVADINLRTEATPEVLSLFSGIGQEYDLTFVRRGGEQIEMFSNEDDIIDSTEAEVEDEVYEYAPPPDDIGTNGTVVSEPESEPEPERVPAAAGRRSRR